jgi:hypothetical protein
MTYDEIQEHLEDSGMDSSDRAVREYQKILRKIKRQRLSIDPDAVVYFARAFDGDTEQAFDWLETWEGESEEDMEYYIYIGFTNPRAALRLMEESPDNFGLITDYPKTLIDIPGEQWMGIVEALDRELVTPEEASDYMEDVSFSDWRSR